MKKSLTPTPARRTVGFSPAHPGGGLPDRRLREKINKNDLRLGDLEDHAVLGINVGGVVHTGQIEIRAGAGIKITQKTTTHGPCLVIERED